MLWRVQTELCLRGAAGFYPISPCGARLLRCSANPIRRKIFELLSFDGIDLADVVSRIPRKGRDRMPFGIIELDYDGRIIAYNMGDAKMSKRNPKEMIGLNFFEDVAPCTKTPVFYGRFKAGVKEGNLNARFDYLFDHEMEPLAVRVTMITSTVENEQRVMVLIRILKDEERDRAQIDHQRMAAITKARAERAEQEQRVPTPTPAAPPPVSSYEKPPSPAPMPKPAPLPPAATFHKNSLVISDIEAIARTEEPAVVTPEMRERCQLSRQLLSEVGASGRPIYGLTSGFGALLDQAASEPEQHQMGLVRHLASGIGRPFSVVQTRAAMAARLHTLGLGHSAASDATLDMLALFLNQGVTPIVPSIGASDDQTPLAHMALGLCGEGDVSFRGQKRSAANVIAELGVPPLRLTQRDGLALVNGCAFSTGIAALNGANARRLLRWTLVAASTYSQIFEAFDESYSSLHAALRPHAGQIMAREQLAQLLQGNTRLRSHRAATAPAQDPYTLRCQTQLFGAFLDALDHHDSTVEIEINSVSDNPIMDPKREELAHGGNFYGLHVGLVSDYLRVALVHSAQWCERAMARLVDPALSSLPAQLRGDADSSGMMGAQVIASSLLAEIKALSMAASIQGASTNANHQDVVPMATLAARMTSDAIEHQAHLVGVLLIGLSQAMDHIARRDKSAFSNSAQDLYDAVREVSPKLNSDRSLSNEFRLMAKRVLSKDPPSATTIWMI